MPRIVPPMQFQQPGAHQHGPHCHHGHQPGQPAPQQAMGQPGQILMQVVQSADGSYGLAPYTPPPQQQQAMGQTPAVAPNWGGLLLLLGGLGVAGYWAYKKWWKKDDGYRSRDAEPERVHESTRGRYGHSYERSQRGRDEGGREGRERGRDIDQRRSRRSKTRMLAEYKRYLDSEGITD